VARGMQQLAYAMKWSHRTTQERDA